MAKRSNPPQPMRAKLNAEEIRKAIKRFESLKGRFEEFDPDVIETRNDPALVELAVASKSALEKTYSEGTTQHEQFAQLGSIEYAVPMYAGRPTPVHELRTALHQVKARSIILLRQAIEDLEEDLQDPSQAEFRGSSVGAVSERAAFIVHGHDEGCRESVARFLERLGIQPIILHEQANKGRTLIEKFEQHGDVAFAVVLLSPDDLGGKTIESLRPRARQNVILELGYFIGALGRGRVCALKKGEVEEPSDILGIAYVEYDIGGAWRQKLAKEIEAIGIEVDWNIVMKA